MGQVQYRLIGRYNGAQLHVEIYLHIQWATGPCIDLLTSIMGQVWYTFIDRYNGAQVHV